MLVADHYWHLLLILHSFIVFHVAGSDGSEIVLTSTYQRGTKICKPVFNCHHGQQIKECAKSYEKETCEDCPGNLVQPDLISSVLKLDSHRKCFRLQEARCSTSDTVPSREKDPQIFCAKYCKCDITKCFWGETSCECNLKKAGCPPNQQLNVLTGECEPCPHLTYKLGNKCGPCEYNETAFINYVNENLATTPETAKPQTPAPTPAPTTPQVKPTTPKPTTATPKVGGRNKGEEGLSSVAITIIAVLVVVLIILIVIILIVVLCYCRGLKCKEMLKKPFAKNHNNIQLKGHRNGIADDHEKLYEEMGTMLPPMNGHANGPERVPLVPPNPPPHHSPTRVPNQPPLLPNQWSAPNPSSGYVSAITPCQEGLRVKLPRQISHPVQDTTPHTPGSGGSASLTSDNLEAMHHYPSSTYLCPGPGISQQPIHARDDRVSDGIDTEVKQQSSPILCTEDNDLPPHFPTSPTNMSTDEFRHQNRGYFQPGAAALEHGENTPKENEEETQPKHGSQSANSSLQRTENDHFVSLNHVTDKKHLMPTNYAEIDKHRLKDSEDDKGGANYMGDEKVSPHYLDMEKKSDFVDKDAYKDEAYESVDPSNYNNAAKDSKDNSIASNYSQDSSGKS